MSPERVSSQEETQARPALSPEEVAERPFATARRGYDRAEVRAFLETLAATLAAAIERIAELERLVARAAVDAEDAESTDFEAVIEAVSAEAWRDEVLADLDRRRRELNREVMRLRAGRDRLREDLGGAVAGLAEQLGRIEGSLQAARAAGDLAEQRVGAEALRSSEERRAELEAARLAGFATVGAAMAGPDESPSPGESPEAPESGSEPPQAPDAGATPAEPAAEPADVDDSEVDELFARLRAERRRGRPAGSDAGDRSQAGS